MCEDCDKQEKVLDEAYAKFTLDIRSFAAKKGFVPYNFIPVIKRIKRDLEEEFQYSYLKAKFEAAPKEECAPKLDNISDEHFNKFLS